ncbi:hypothetical protein MBTS_11165 [Methylobacterium bullatum]|nr:hypothetical protein [Methylobacterium bullatum]
MSSESFVVIAGLLIRWQLISMFKEAALQNGLSCSHERAGPTIRFTISGEPRSVSIFISVAKRWISRFAD